MMHGQKNIKSIQRRFHMQRLLSYSDFATCIKFMNYSI
jgi:hypothetical protein